VKYAYVLLAVCCCLSGLSAQWIEKFIQVPDSFYGLMYPAHLAYSPVSQMVYVGGDNPKPGASVTGVDIRTWTKQAKIPCDNYAVKGLGYNPLDDKLYILSNGNAVTVVECDGNRVLAELRVPGIPLTFCHNLRYDKVYVGSDSSLTIIDGAGDSIRRTIALVGYPVALVSNESLGKVYYLVNPGRIQVVDASADTVVAVIPVSNSTRGLALSPDGLKLYCASSDTLAPGLVIVDCVADTIARFLPLPSPVFRLCSAPPARKLYCGSSRDTIMTVVDMDADTVLASIGGVSAQVLSYFAPRNLIYCSNSSGESLAIVDVAADTVLNDAGVGHGPCVLLPMPDEDLMCVITAGDRLLLPLDCATNVPRDTVLVGPYPSYGLAYDERDDKLFVACPLGDVGLLAVVNGTTRELEGWHLIEGRPVEVFYNPADNKLYCLQERARTGVVFDAAAETVIATVEAPYAPYKTFVSPRRDWVYFIGFYGDVIVVDGRADSTVARIVLGDEVCDVAYNSANDKIYFVLYDGGLAVLDCSTNTVVTRPLRYPSEGGVCYNSRNNRVYVACHTAGRILVFDGQSDSVLGETRVGPGPLYLCYNPLRNEVYCVIDGHYPSYDSVVRVLDCDADTVVATLVTGVHTIAPTYNPAGDKVYCLRNFGNLMSLAVIDCEEKRLVADLPLMYDNIEMEVDTVRNVTYVNWREGFLLTVIADSDYVGLAAGSGTHARQRSQPTIVRGVLLFEARGERRDARGEMREARGELLDISGRRVLDLKPGANDVSGLSPGVYFVREPSAVSREPSAVTKVVLTR
jgi:DNA-binding beta-propeller fold protein YncE